MLRIIANAEAETVSHSVLPSEMVLTLKDMTDFLAPTHILAIHGRNNPKETPVRVTLVPAIATLPFETRARLCPLVHTVVLLQSPSVALGLPIPQGLLIPHTDPRIPAEEKGSTFAKWVSSYFLHGDLTGHELEQLTYDKTDPSRPSTIEKLNPEEFLAITDFGPGDKYDSIIGLSPFRNLLFAQMHKALFDPEVRAAWGANFWNIYGDAEPWPMMYAAWFLEEFVDVRKAPELALTFQVIDGANHFVWLPWGTWQSANFATRTNKDFVI
ncbi:hypothetical protein B0H11DRAFT_2342791 [Mycena galericulata]|nr:hypothetical protein B0H11DRAFT_2342791 [Mycena galericulata]